MKKIALASALCLGATMASADTGPTPVTPFELMKTAELSSVGMISGKGPRGRWVGGVAVIDQSDCHLAVTTAGHNIKDGWGRPTAALDTMRIHLSGLKLPVIAAMTDPFEPSTTAPENDWAVVVAKKPACGQAFRTLKPTEFDQAAVALEGTPVEMVCFHHDQPALKDRLSRETCNLYPPGSAFEGLYTQKIGEPVALHSCRAKLGTSGCPLIRHTQNGPEFIGTQIEAHVKTGAGVARLFTAAYSEGLSRALREMDANERLIAANRQARLSP